MTGSAGLIICFETVRAGHVGLEIGDWRADRRHSGAWHSGIPRCALWDQVAHFGGFQAAVLVAFLARQASEQYNTDPQFFAQALRHVMVRPHTAHSLLGRLCLLPLKSFFM